MIRVVLDTNALASGTIGILLEATLQPITATVSRVATHPEDDLIPATASSAQADYLVTGDVHLQRRGAYQGVTILFPRAFLDLLSDPHALDLAERE